MTPKNDIAQSTGYDLIYRGLRTGTVADVAEGQTFDLNRIRKKILSYDSDCQALFHSWFYVEAQNQSAFEQILYYRLLNLRIKYDNYNVFIVKLNSVHLENLKVFDFLYEHMVDIMSGGSSGTSTTNSNNEGTSSDRGVFVDLPQDQVVLDLTNNIFNYATNNAASNQSNSGTSSSNESHTGTAFNSEAYLKMSNAMSDLINVYVRALTKEVFNRNEYII